MDIWTEEDERALLAAQKRKTATQDVAREQLLALMARYIPKQNGSTYSGHYSPRDLAAVLIANGGEFRDALLPFDHMGRDKAKDAP